MKSLVFPSCFRIWILLGNPNDIIQYIAYIAKSGRTIEEIREVLMKLIKQRNGIGGRHDVS